MQSASIDRKATRLLISGEQARQRAREIMGAKFLEKHRRTSVVVAFSARQLAELERVVNGLLAAAKTSTSEKQIIHFDAFSASARQLAALSISIRRPSLVKHWPCPYLPAPGAILPTLGAIQVVVAGPLSSLPQDIQAITLAWRNPNWVLDFFVSATPSPSNPSPTTSSGGAKAKGAKETALRKKMSRAQKRQRARAAREVARRADPVYQLEEYRKAQKAKARKLAMKKGLTTGKPDPSAGSRIMRSNRKVVQGGLPGLGKRR